MKKRVVSLLLAISMMLTIFPVSVFAEDNTGGGTIQTVGGTNGTLAIGEDGKPYNPQNPGATSGDGWYIGDYYLYLTGTNVIFDFSEVKNPVTVGVYIGNSSTDTGNTIKGGTFNGNQLYVHRDNKLEDVTASKDVGLYDTAQILSGIYTGSVTLRGNSKIINGTFTGDISLSDTSEIVNCTFTGGQVTSYYNSHAKVSGGTYICSNIGFYGAEVSNIVFKGKYLNGWDGCTFENCTFLMGIGSSYASSIRSSTIKNSVFIGPVTFSDTASTIESGIFLADPSTQTLTNTLCQIQLNASDDKGIRSVYLLNGDERFGADYSHFIGDTWYNVAMPKGIWIVGNPTVLNGYDKVEITSINPITGVDGLESSEYTLRNGNHTIVASINKGATLNTHILPALSFTDEGLPDTSLAYDNGQDEFYGKSWEYRKLNPSDTEKTLILTSNEYDKFNLAGKTINCPVLVQNGVSIAKKPDLFTKDVTFDGGISKKNYTYKNCFAEGITLTITNGGYVELEEDVSNITVNISGENSNLRTQGSTMTGCTVSVSGENSIAEISKFTGNGSITLHSGSVLQFYSNKAVTEGCTVTAYNGSKIDGDGYIASLTIADGGSSSTPCELASGQFKSVTVNSAAGILVSGGYIGNLNANNHPVQQTGGVFQNIPTSMPNSDKLRTVKFYVTVDAANGEFRYASASVNGYDVIHNLAEGTWDSWGPTSADSSPNGEWHGYVLEGTPVQVSSHAVISDLSTDPNIPGFSYEFTDNKSASFIMPAADVHVNSFKYDSLKTNAAGEPDTANLYLGKYTFNNHDAWLGNGWKYEWRSYGDTEGYCVVIPSGRSGQYDSYGSSGYVLSCPLIIENGGEFIWFGTVSGPVYNSGKISTKNDAVTYTGTVYNLDVPGSETGGTITGGKYTGTVYNGTVGQGTHNTVLNNGLYEGTLVNYATLSYDQSALVVCTGTLENYGVIEDGVFTGTTHANTGTISGGIFTEEQTNGTTQVKVLLAQNAGENHFTHIDSWYPFSDETVQVLYHYGMARHNMYFSADKDQTRRVNGYYDERTLYFNSYGALRLAKNYASSSRPTDYFTEPLAIVGSKADLTLDNGFPTGSQNGTQYAAGNGWYYIPNGNGGGDLCLTYHYDPFTKLTGTLSDNVRLEIGTADLNSPELIVNTPVRMTSRYDSKIYSGTFNNRVSSGADYTEVHGGTFNGDTSGVALDIPSDGGDCYIYGGQFNGSLEINKNYGFLDFFSGTFEKTIASHNPYAQIRIFGGIYKDTITAHSHEKNNRIFNGFFVASSPLDLTYISVTGGFFNSVPTATYNNATFHKIYKKDGTDFTLTDAYDGAGTTNYDGHYSKGFLTQDFTNAYTVKDTKVCVTTTTAVTHVNGIPVDTFLANNGGSSTNDGKTLTFTMPDSDVELQTVPVIKNYDLTLPSLVSSVTVTPAGGTAETKTAVDGKVSVPEGSTVNFDVSKDSNSQEIDAEYLVIDEQNTPAYNPIYVKPTSGVGTFTMPSYNASLRQLNQLHFDVDGKPITTGTYKDTDGILTGSGWYYSNNTLTISTSAAVDISGDTNRVVTVPTTVNGGNLKGFIFTNTVELGTNFDSYGSFEDTIVYGALTGTTTSLHKLTTTPASCTVLPKSYTGTLDFTGTAYVSKDMELKVTKPSTITTPVWTIPASVTLTDGTDENSDTIRFKMPDSDTLLAVAEKLLPATQYDITVALPGDVDFAPATATDVVTVVPKAAEGEEVTLSFNSAYLPADCGMEFGQWVVTDAQNAAVTVTDGKFTMPASNVTVTFTLKSTSTDPDTPVEPEQPNDDVGTGVAIVLGVAAAGGVAYAAGTQIWLETHLPDGVIPTNREQLALMLWKEADKPTPQSTTLYTDIAAADTDGQLAARWCTEQGLMKDFDEGTTFKPGDYVFRPQVIKAWTDLQQLLQARK